MLLTRLARAEFSSPSKIRGSQLTITRQPLTAAASERFKELAQMGEHPQGYPGEGDAALFYRLGEKLLGQLHLQLKQVTAALPWTPSPAACKAPLRKSVSSRRKKKSTKPPCSEPKDTAELEEREGELLAARCLPNTDRFQQGWGHATGAGCARPAPALPEGTLPPETLPALRCGISSSAEQISPHRRQGWMRHSFLPGKTETTEKLESPRSWEKP